MPWIDLRRDQDVGGIARRMEFWVDGQRVARLRRGATARIEVAVGTRVVQARMDWLSSAPLELSMSTGTSRTVTGALTAHSITFTGTFLRPGTALELLAT